ncbi:DUF5665 domain-containing protein [Nereida ignava]|jgi:hypothetical protein|uniref:Uncharacterized protein n=1 Tax=Nereida ignava TaxID=282199 RepID=A0A0U1NJZ8_9RHOB|nr:DUF5665 domain-containing protein [Nereida ignava]CRK75015.1 hypothetical protein NIG5292_01056 [Nereida ignava]SFJ04024.1 hypothetical protein SAMN02745667_00257 [Nereida ignava DSM 16309]
MDQDIKKLAAEVAKLNGHRFVTMHNSVPKMLAFNFARGLAFGLGSVIGATLLVSVLVYLLSQIDFIPIIGEWATVLSTALADINGAMDENANGQ